MNIWNREPASILAAFQAIIALAIGFGVMLSQEQFALLMAALTAVIGLITRSQVTPVNKP